MLINHPETGSKMNTEKRPFYVWEFGEFRVRRWLPPELKDPKRLLDRQDIQFKRGEFISAKVPLVEFVADSREKFADYQFNLAGLPLFSPKLRDILQNIGIDNIQYFEARILRKTGKLVQDDYMVANVTGTVKCFDWERSEYDDTDRADGIVTHMDKLVLDLGSVGNRRLFRMTENASILLVAASVKERLETEHVTGIRFTPPEEFEV